MWQCPNCGERIDDKFDACWKCGTARDGTRAVDFRAEPDDPVVPDLGPDREPPPQSEEERQVDRILHERLVEVCSAGNIVEADGLCELLEDAGIHARVVGEGPGVAAGGLALGEDVSPRIWVRENDVARAREVIDQWRARQANEVVELPESETPLESETLPESQMPVEAERASLPSDVRLRFLSQGFFIAGAACILIGAIWAWKNSTVLSTYSGTAVGRFDSVHLGRLRVVSPPRERDVPPGPIDGGPSFRYSYNMNYVYTVKGKTYDASMTVDRVNPALDRVAIHYDPHDPAENVVGAIAPPWMVLLFASLAGAFLCFVGYQFR